MPTKPQPADGGNAAGDVPVETPETWIDPRVPRIIPAISAIIGDLPAIGKDSVNPQQNFNFRSVDAVLDELKPLLARHGVVIVPDVIERIVNQRTTGGGKIMYEVNLHVRFRFYAGDGSSVTASAWGEGTDMGDKATNKAMTMAFKYATGQVFAIATGEPDADGITMEETVRQETAGHFVPATSWPELLDRMGHIMGGMEDAPEWLREAIAARFDGKETADLMRDEKVTAMSAANHVLDDLEQEFAGEVVTPSRDRVAEAFSKHWDGIALHGPPWQVTAGEGLPSYDDVMAERAAEADPGPEPDPGELPVEETT